jgi:hypothetical protein
MPYMTEGIAKHVPEYEAWRWAFFLPGCLYILITFLILLLGQVCSACLALHGHACHALEHVKPALAFGPLKLSVLKRLLLCTLWPSVTIWPMHLFL